MNCPEISLAQASRLDPTPSFIAGNLIDGSIAAWRHQAPFYGPLTARWTGQPKTLPKRFGLLVHHLDCLLMRMRAHWSCEVQSDPLEGDPVAILVTGYDRPTTVIPVEITGRTIKIGGREGSIALASNIAGRQILERTSECIGLALGRRIGRHA